MSRRRRVGRRLRNTYYLAAAFNASAAAMSFAVAGRLLFALAAPALALLGVVQRRRVLPRMDSLQAQIQACVASAVPAFRRIHVAAILVNLAQLAFIVWSLVAASIQLKQ